MRIAQVFLWILVGAGTAALYLISQMWSVNHLNPYKQPRSLHLIIGGTILRWAFIGAVLGLAISNSYIALIVVFSTFMVIRFLFLLKWQGWLQIKNPFIRQS